MQSYSDEHLMEIFQNNKDGQKALAFDHLYKRYAKSMLQFFYFALHSDYAKAQDFVHDLFLKVIEKPRYFDSSQNFKAWFFRIASNMCKNEYRSVSITKKYQLHITKNFSNEIIIDSSEKSLRECIYVLSQEHRSLLIFRFKLNLSVKEMSEIYECPEGTIKSRLFYATKELSKLYKL